MPVRRTVGTGLSSPLVLVLFIGVIGPALLLLVYSFYRYSLFQIHPAFQLGGYQQIFSQSLYRTVAWNTLAIAVPTTIVSVAGGYAIAYYIVFVAGRDRTLVLALVVIAMLASYLARIYAWRTLMGSNGVINSLLEHLGIIQHPFGFILFSRFAVIVAEVNLYMPICALISFASLSGVAPEVREVARDLGAGRFQTLRRVTLPLSGSAVYGSAALAFFLSCGDYITPVFLGGPSSSQTFGTTIASQVITDANYPFAAALSVVMVLAFAVYAVLLRGAMRWTRLLPAGWRA